jgi:hypothetical protein
LQLLGVACIGVTEGAGALDQVALRALAGLLRVLGRIVREGARCARGMPPVLAAAEDDVGLALVEVLAGDLVLAAPVGGAR